MKRTATLLSLGLLACTPPLVDGPANDRTSPSDAPPTMAPRARVTAPFDVQRAIGRVQDRFHRDGPRAVAKAPTLDVVAESGRVTLTPRHFGSDNAPISGASATFETQSMLRSEPLDVRSTETSVARDGSLRIDRGIVVERFVHHPAGVEQRWEFDAVPPGTSDLRLAVAVNGQSYVGHSPSGHHFVDTTNDVGLLYGPAIWIDALGRKTPIDVRWTGTALELVVPSAVLEDSRYPAVLDPVISAEFGIDVPATGPSATLAREAASASDGTDFFVVWSDIRNPTNYDIYGARVSSTGALLDTVDIPIATEDYEQSAPKVAFNGTNYLVVWQDERNGNNDIYAARVTPAGVVLDPNGFVISDAASDQTAPSVSASGTTWVVTWDDMRSGDSEVYLARVLADGTNLDPGGVVVASGYRPAVGCDSVRCLVAYNVRASLEEDLMAVRVRVGDAVVLDNPALELSAEDHRQTLPSIAGDGTTFVIAWQDSRTPFFNVFTNRVLSADGTVLDGAGDRSDECGCHQRSVSVVYRAPNFVLTWHDNRAGNYDIRGQQMLADNTKGTPFVVTSAATTESFSTVAASGTQYFAAWQQHGSGTPGISAVRIADDWTVLDSPAVTVSISGARQVAASVAHDGNNYLLVYADSRTTGGDGYDIRAASLSNEGAVLGVVDVATVAGLQLAPDVVWDPDAGQFMVVWTDRRGADFDVYAQRVQNGVPPTLIGGEIAVTTGAARERFARVAYNRGSNTYLVAWMDRRSGNDDIYAARIDAAGTLLDATGIAVATEAGAQARPDVESDGTAWLVVWSDGRADAVGGEDIYGARVTAAGAPGTPFVVSNAANLQQYPRVTHNGTDYFVTWADTRVNLDNSDVYGARVTNAGALLDANGIGLATSATLSEGRPDVAPVAQGQLVVWRQQVAAASDKRDLAGRHFGTDGAPTEAAFVVSASLGDEDQPAIAPWYGPNALIVYSRFDATATIRSERVFARRVSVGAGPRLETFNVTSGNGWTRVDTAQTYTSMVPICNLIYTDGLGPVVTRVRSVTATSFEFATVLADGTNNFAANVAVQCLSVDEGVYTRARDGVDMEVVRFDSTNTAHDQNWNAVQARTYQQTYTAPVVVGQVITANDPDWSVFWARGNAGGNPPTAADLRVGKHVAEDGDTTRANETVGYMVIETGTGIFNGRVYQAALGANTIEGLDAPNNPPSTYAVTNGNHRVAILSSAGMNGNNGGWPTLYGADPLRATAVDIVMREDTIGDVESYHIAEEIAYIIID